MKTMQFTKLSSVLVLGSALLISACSETESEVNAEPAVQEQVVEQAAPQVEEAPVATQEVVAAEEQVQEAVQETTEAVVEEASEEPASEETSETNNAE